jgi:hypothetical protein
LPISTSMSTINTTVGYTSTRQTGLGDTRVRRLAARSSGIISFSDCRWGIAVPARSILNTFNGASYDTSDLLSIQAQRFTAGNVTSRIDALSGGTLRYQTDHGGGTSQFDYTWLIIGSNSEYTIRFDVTSGSLTSGTTGSDLALTSNRSFVVTQNGAGQKTCTGNLILKRSGVTLITRPVSLDVNVDSL